MVITAPNPELKLKPRLTANVNIFILDRKDVLCVSSRALRFNPNAALAGPDALIQDWAAPHKVWTRQGHTFTAHAVETGISNGIQTEILSGIAEGTEIVTEATIHNSTPQPQTAQSEKSPFAPGPPGKKK